MLSPYLAKPEHVCKVMWRECVCVCERVCMWLYARMQACVRTLQRLGT